jgi:predicted MFS family arabinose efflux permease
MKSRSTSSAQRPHVTFSAYQIFVVALLAFLQFTIILDFVIISPLGALIMPALDITTSQFGFVISVYAFSAGASGLLAAGFADKYDRKKLLLFFYSGFIFGTLLCGMATTYEFLIMARIITGIFGGVIGSIVFAIATDLFPFEARGRVMGAIQTAFSVSQILGVPAGLYLSNHINWQAPFLMIVAVCLLVGILIFVYLRPINSHLAKQKDENPFLHIYHTISIPRHIQGFAATILLATGGFMLMPFGSAYSVNNLKINVEELPLVYLATGLGSIIAGPLIGRLSDKIGKLKVFMAGSILSIVMVLIYTHLGPISLHTLMLVSVLLFIGISARMIPSQALMTAVPKPENRGSFMSVNSAIQQFSGGVASLAAGLIVTQGPDGHLFHFDVIGYVVSAAIVITMLMMYRINRTIKNQVLD